MNKRKNFLRNTKGIVDKEASFKKNTLNDEEYGYDFVPTLNVWETIDDQKEKVKELENISKNKRK